MLEKYSQLRQGMDLVVNGRMSDQQFMASMKNLCVLGKGAGGVVSFVPLSVSVSFLPCSWLFYCCLLAQKTKIVLSFFFRVARRVLLDDRVKPKFVVQLSEHNFKTINFTPAFLIKVSKKNYRESHHFVTRVGTVTCQPGKKVVIRQTKMDR